MDHRVHLYWIHYLFLCLPNYCAEEATKDVTAWFYSSDLAGIDSRRVHQPSSRLVDSQCMILCTACCCGLNDLLPSVFSHLSELRVEM